MAEGNKSRQQFESPGQNSFHLMAKPAGPSCNLCCSYCFYLEKKVYFSGNGFWRMSGEVLEAYIREYINSQPGPSVVFDWQGGEPTLLGVDFFKRALDLQKKYHQGKQISNTLQTNGTLLDEAWCAFLAKNKFLVGLSMDGPEAIHNACRVDKNGEPTGDRVLNALRLMQKHGVEVNILAAVNSISSRHPLDVYRYFKKQGVHFIQFIPIVERLPDPGAEKPELSLATPPSLFGEEKSRAVTPWSVEPEQYGDFLISIFDEWIRNDVGDIFVMNFEWLLGIWAGMGPGVCYLSRRCGQSLILEHNGDVFSCDHFMYPGYRLGNILKDGLRKMAESKNQIAFGAAKETALPDYCRRCNYLFACRGGCPKHRFLITPDGKPGLNYLCTGLRKFYDYVSPAMKEMTELIGKGIPARKIMETAHQRGVFGEA